MKDPIVLIPLLNVRDLERSLRFYEGALGFAVEARFEHEGALIWARLQRGGIELMLNRSPARIERGERPDARSYGDAVLCVRVEDVAPYHAALERAGASPGPIAREDYGLYEFLVRDPDGYELAFQAAA